MDLSRVDWTATLFLALGIGLVILMVKWHVDGSKFDFRDALLDPDTDRISFSRLGHFISLIVSTFIICYETAIGRLTEWLFTGYMVAWAATFVAAKAIDRSTPYRHPYDYRQPDDYRPSNSRINHPNQDYRPNHADDFRPDA